MSDVLVKLLSAATLLLLLCAGTEAWSQTKPEGQAKDSQRESSEFNGFTVFMTDGQADANTCFRFGGELTSAHFFDGLKRYDGPDGPVFRRDSEVVTDFPDEVVLHFLMRELPCPAKKGKKALPSHLTPDLVKGLKFDLYWKRGMEMRPVEKMSVDVFRGLLTKDTVSYRLPPDSGEYLWQGHITVKSSGVPLTDSLVLVILRPDGETAARTAARF